MDEDILEQMKQSGRYPYTYAADYLRQKIGDDYGKGLISRAAASQAQSLIADSLGIDKEQVSKALADCYIKEYGV